MSKASLVTQRWRICLLAKETRAQSLGGEDALETEMAPTPVFLPGEFRGQRSLVGYSSRGHKESDMTEWLTHTYNHSLINMCWGLRDDNEREGDSCHYGVFTMYLPLCFLLAWIKSFNPHKSPLRWVSLLFPFYRWENWGSERFSNLVKDHKLVRGGDQNSRRSSLL